MIYNEKEGGPEYDFSELKRHVRTSEVTLSVCLLENFSNGGVLMYSRIRLVDGDTTLSNLQIQRGLRIQL